MEVTNGKLGISNNVLKDTRTMFKGRKETDDYRSIHYNNEDICALIKKKKRKRNK